MLCLSRKKNEAVYLDSGRIRVYVAEIQKNQVRLAFDCPKDMVVDRKEVHELKQASGQVVTQE